MGKFKIFFLIFTLLFTLGLEVSAQEATSVTVTETVNLDEDIQPEDLGISEPWLLPDSPFYFLKNWLRGFESAFTFNPVKKAELRMKFSNEKLIELKKLVEQNKNKETIEKGITNYQKEIEQVQKATEKIKEKAEQNVEVGKFLDKFVQQQILQQRILEKLETQVPTTTFEKIKAAREEHLERFSEVMNKLEMNKEKIQERLEQNLEKISTSTKETIIQIRDRIMEKIQQRNTQGTTTGNCITLWDPVCGKNGKTYSNECFAAMAGVEIDYKEVCKEESICAKEEEKVNRNPLMGATNQLCCAGLTEIRVSKSYSVCKKLSESEEMSLCSTDSDCALVDTNCCGCTAGGGKKCINKDYVGEWNERLDCVSKLKEGLSCPQEYRCAINPTECSCLDGMCVGIIPAELEE